MKSTCNLVYFYFLGLNSKQIIITHCPEFTLSSSRPVWGCSLMSHAAVYCSATCKTLCLHRWWMVMSLLYILYCPHKSFVHISNFLFSLRSCQYLEWQCRGLSQNLSVSFRGVIVLSVQSVGGSCFQMQIFWYPPNWQIISFPYSIQIKWNMAEGRQEFVPLASGRLCLGVSEQPSSSAHAPTWGHIWKLSWLLRQVWFGRFSVGTDGDRVYSCSFWRADDEDYSSHLKAFILLHQFLLGEQVLGLDVLQTGRPLFTLSHTDTVQKLSDKYLWHIELVHFSDSNVRQQRRTVAKKKFSNVKHKGHTLCSRIEHLSA